MSQTVQNPPVDLLAHLLGLEVDPAKLWVCYNREDEKMETIEQVTTFRLKLSPKRRRGFEADFVASYLPEFVDRYSSIGDKGQLLLFVILFKHKALFARFVRERPAAALALWHVLHEDVEVALATIESVSSNLLVDHPITPEMVHAMGSFTQEQLNGLINEFVPRLMQISHDGPELTKKLDHAVMRLSFLFWFLIDEPALVFNPVSSSAALLDQLKTTAATYSSVVKRRAALNDHDDPSGAGRLDDFIELAEPYTDPTRIPALSGFGVWWRCQLEVHRWQEGDDGGDPVCNRRMADDGPMWTCARCKSVRYCSKEHQIADWPTHKPFCRTPVWGAE